MNKKEFIIECLVLCMLFTIIITIIIVLAVANHIVDGGRDTLYTIIGATISIIGLRLPRAYNKVTNDKTSNKEKKLKSLKNAK